MDSFLLPDTSGVSKGTMLSGSSLPSPPPSMGQEGLSSLVAWRVKDLPYYSTKDLPYHSTVALATTVLQVGPLAWDFAHAIGTAKKSKNKNKAKRAEGCTCALHVHVCACMCVCACILVAGRKERRGCCRARELCPCHSPGRNTPLPPPAGQD